MKRSILTLAIALAFSFTAAPADAGLTEGQKCAMKANLLSGKFSLCLSKADANVSKGRVLDTVAADAKCETKFRDGWGKTREKAQDKDASLGADCDGAMSDAVRDSVEASALITAGRDDLAAFAVSENDIAGDSGIQELIDDAVAAVDITSNDQSVCETAGGSWEYDAGDTCSVEESLSVLVNSSNIGHIFGRVDLAIEFGTHTVEDMMGEEYVSLQDRDVAYDTVAEGLNIQSGGVVEIENTTPATWTGYRVILGVDYNGSFSPKWYGPVRSLDSGWESLQLTSPSLPVTVSPSGDDATRVEWGQNEITGFAVEIVLSSAPSLACEAAGGTRENSDASCTAADITSDNQTVCEAANGTWDGSGCTPAAVADRDCFRAGFCGAGGANKGDYVGVTASSTGCSQTTPGSNSYTLGLDFWTCVTGPSSCPVAPTVPAVMLSGYLCWL